MKIYVMADIAATVVTVIAYFFYDFHLNRVSGYYRVFMIMGLLSLFIANFRRIFNNVGDKLRASVLWVLIINNTNTTAFICSFKKSGWYVRFACISYAYRKYLHNISIIIQLSYELYESF